jgi:hypothetical protein
MCLCVALVIQHAMRIRRIVICDLSGSALFSHIITSLARFAVIIERKVRGLICSTTSV